MNYDNIVARCKALESFVGGHHWKDNEVVGLWENLTIDGKPPTFTEEDFKIKYNIEIEKLNNLSYIGEREKAYALKGLTFNYWNEITIENNQAKIDKYISDRDQIRLDIPNPNL